MWGFTQNSFRRFLFPSIFALVLSICSNSLAAVFEWVNPQGGMYFDSLNWRKQLTHQNGIPGVDDEINFNQLGVGSSTTPYSVIFDSFEEARGLQSFWDAPVTLEMHGNGLTLSGTNNIGDVLTLGNHADLTVQNGSLDLTTAADVSRHASIGPAKLSLTDSSSLFSAGTIALDGNTIQGSSIVNVLNGSTVSVDGTTQVGTFGTVDIQGVGSSWTTQTMWVRPSSGSGSATSQNASLIAREGAAVHVLGQSIISNSFDDSTSDVLITDTGTSWRSDSTMKVGYGAGAGSFTVRNGASAVSNGFVLVGDSFEGSHGEVEVTDNDSTWSYASQFRVGSVGFGSLTIGSGGKLSVSPSASSSDTIGFVGDEESAIGAATISGVGSEWRNEYHQLIVGNFGDGTLSILDGGTVISSGSNSASNSSGVIGGRQTGVGLATVSGNGSTWENRNGTLVVGFFGQGELQVQQGGAVTSSNGYVGREPGSSGTISILGNGSNWSVVNTLSIAGTDSAAGGAGSLIASEGGLVDVGSKLQMWSSGTIATANGGKINIGGGNTVDDSVRIGGGGTLRGGGLIDSTVINDGGVILADSVLEISSDYIHNQASTLEVQLFNPGLGQNMSKLDVAGNLNLQGGSLLVTSIGTPAQKGQSFDILDFGTLTGTFDSIDLPGEESSWDTSQLLSDGIITFLDPPPLETVMTVEASSMAQINLTGPESKLTYFNIEGIGHGQFATYGVLQFDLTSIRQQLDDAFKGNPWQLDELKLELTQANASFTANGDVEILHTDEDSVPIEPGSSTPSYPLENDFGEISSILTYTFNEVLNGHTDSYQIYSSGEDAPTGGILVDQVLTDDLLTLLLVEGSPAVAATYAGTAHSLFPGPTLQIRASLADGTLPGDFNRDLKVDGVDFLLWQRGATDDPLSPSALSAWQANYGSLFPNSNSNAIQVPEPASCLLLLSLIPFFGRIS